MTVSEPAGIVIPRGWWSISLQPDAVRKRQILQLVNRQFSGTGASAELKVSVRKALQGVAADAARSGGTVLAMDLTRVGQAPMPSTLLVYRPPAPRTMSAVIERLRDKPHAVVAEREHGPLVRLTTVGESPDVEGASAGEQLRVEYWLDPKDGWGLYHAVFTSPLVQFQEQLTELFDTMVSTVSAPADEPEPVRANTLGAVVNDAD